MVSNDESAIGKMFGVLLVQNPQGEIGFLSAFSGKVAEQNLLPGFVPPVFDMLTKESFFHREFAEITDINHQVKQLSQSAELAQLLQQIEADRQAYQAQEQAQRQAMIEGRAARKQQREQAEATLTGDALKAVLDDLAKQSVAEKNVLKYLKLEWDEKLANEEARLQELLTQLDTLKEQRKALSNALQHKLFAQYRFLNGRGEPSDLNAIFAPTTSPVPPAGSGECAAPKLLQYAFTHGLKPLAMAEFWWGYRRNRKCANTKSFTHHATANATPFWAICCKG